ncbi:hypothetical protein ACXC9Q_32405 [Kribbella sp. CWNU-51]
MTRQVWLVLATVIQLTWQLWVTAGAIPFWRPASSRLGCIPARPRRPASVLLAGSTPITT